jgi:hypothetical protein
MEDNLCKIISDACKPSKSSSHQTTFENLTMTPRLLSVMGWQLCLLCSMFSLTIGEFPAFSPVRVEVL